MASIEDINEIVEGLPALATVREVAALLRVDHWSVRRWIRDGVVAAYKIGGLIRVPRSSVRSALVELGRDE